MGRELVGQQWEGVMAFWGFGAGYLELGVVTAAAAAFGSIDYCTRRALMQTKDWNGLLILQTWTLM